MQSHVNQSQFATELAKIEKKKAEENEKALSELKKKYVFRKKKRSKIKPKRNK